MLIHYDLSKSPVTHDFVNFLARAEIERKRVGADHLHVNIMPGLRDFSQRDKTLSAAHRRFIGRDLLPQLAWLLPSVTNVTFSPEGEQVIPYLNLGFSPGILFSASEHARNTVRDYLKDKPNPVSITLRQSSFEPNRNSNLDEWKRVAAWLRSRKFYPVVVPDIAVATGQSAHPVIGRDTYSAAALNADLRLALYEQCRLNLMNNHGPMLVALMADVRLLVFRVIVPGVPTCQPEPMAKAYFHPEANWGEGKRLFWKDDTASEIIPRIEEALQIA